MTEGLLARMKRMSEAYCGNGKPHITASQLSGCVYACWGFGCIGSGTTVKAAYDDWLVAVRVHGYGVRFG